MKSTNPIANVAHIKDAAEPIAHDLIWSAKSIGDEIGVNERRAFYLLESGLIPAKKIGGFWVSSRRRLRERLCVTD